jgi:outer membrane protein assembly factor BamB
MRNRKLLGLIACAATAANWPEWRGPDGTGIASGPAPVARWSANENVLWRTPLPEPGNSTPVVWGSSLFLTQPKKGGHRLVLCLDRATGKIKWEAGVQAEADEPTHSTNPYGSASPAVDGERVVAWFGSAGVVALDHQGKQLWRTGLGRQRHTWGYAASPVIAGDLVLVHFGPGDRSFLAALDKKNGKILWQKDFAPGKGAAFANWSPEDMYGSWSTPFVLRRDGKTEIVLTAPGRVIAFDPSTGKELWSADGLGDLVYPSAVHGDGAILAASGFGGPVMAVKPGGQQLWRQAKGRNLIGSAVLTGGHAYMVDTLGIAHCMKLDSGETVWSQRLQADGEDNGVWSSPVLHDNKVYVMNKSGRVFVFAARPKYESYGVYSVGEPTNSSVVLVDGVIYLRTHAAIWAIGTKSN